MNEAAAVRGDHQVAGSGGAVRLLERDDLPATIAILTSNPVENVFVAARIRSAGLEQTSLGCAMWGFERAGVLRSLCHAGFNLVPVNADAEAVAAFAGFAGRDRMCSSIFGPSTVVMDLWHQLSERWGGCWADVREVRPRQPVLSIETEPSVEPNPAVRRVTIEHWDAYFDAAVKMYTEEVGVSPIQGNPAGYRFYVRQLITSGRAFALFDGPRVLFKADLGSVSGTVSQVQGVWVDPELRGRGMAAPAMAAVVRLARKITPTVSLYVNDFNTRALRAYLRVGFTPVGEFATVLY
ncbi:MAG TPA: GNAT family N-acetyltransferase [Propionibacteriaceae bacterium]|nr:GNAT family N-acetyltransferase [Propionibacteriaceae bacterium]